jgi:transposase
MALRRTQVAQHYGTVVRHLLSPHLYRTRNLVERFFYRIKQCRRPRYDELAANYLGFVKLASIRLWLRVHEVTT